MRWLFFVLQGISISVTILCLIYIIGFLYNKYRSNKSTIPLSRIKTYQCIIIVALVSTIVISAPFQQLLQVGNITFRPEGTYCYYVAMENDEGSQDVTVPACVKISISSEDEEGMYGDKRSIFYVHYYLEEVYFDNNTVHFYDENEIKVNEMESVCDESNKSWVCILLNERAYYPRTTADNGITAFSVTLFCIELIILISAFVLLENNKRKQKCIDKITHV